MMDENLHEIHQSQAEQLGIMFFCLAAIWCFCLGVYYWVRLVGVFPVENWRFDLMDWQWRSLSAALAVLYPVAACGLWLQSRWGVILWLLGGVAESVCYMFLHSWFHDNFWLPFIHLVFLAGWGGVIFYGYRFTHDDDDETVIAEY